MNPALSVVFFTVLLGAGLGLIVTGAVAQSLGMQLAPRAVLIVSVVLTVVGLLSSMAHLGQPLRAWRAFSQWRTSWLSREGVASVATLVAASLCYLWPHSTTAWVVCGLLALVTLRCTAGIYTSLKTIPEWHNYWVLPIFVALSVAAGATAWLAIDAWNRPLNLTAWSVTLTVLVSAWAAKSLYWRWIRTLAMPVSSGSALGLGDDTHVENLFKPHTETNYLMREMGYPVVREHANLLRWVALAFGLLLPSGLLLLVQAGLVSATISLPLAAVLVLLGQVAERWLFFAEARHVVQLYYQPGR